MAGRENTPQLIAPAADTAVATIVLQLFIVVLVSIWKELLRFPILSNCHKNELGQPKNGECMLRKVVWHVCREPLQIRLTQIGRTKPDTLFTS